MMPGMSDAELNVMLGCGGIALAIYGPWSSQKFIPAWLLLAAAAFNVGLGLATLANA